MDGYFFHQAAPMIVVACAPCPHSALRTPICRTLIAAYADSFYKVDYFHKNDAASRMQGRSAHSLRLALI